MANLPTRNQNPGDLKNPSTGQFLSFNTPEEGFAALKRDIQGKQTGNTSTGLGPQSTLQDFASTWAPASDHNDPIAYAGNLSKKLGVTPDTPISKVNTDQLALAVAGNEGYQGPTPGGSSAPGGTYSLQQFGDKVKSKYPQYADMDSTQLAQKILQKYPQYLDMVGGATDGTPTAQAATTGGNNPVSSLLQPQQTPTAPTSQSAPAPIDTAQSGGADGLLKKGLNFFFPIAQDVSNDLSGKNDKTALQQAGDLGLSALPFVPGLGELGEGVRGAGLLAKLGGSAVAKGAAVGYGAGVAQNLSQGKDIPSAVLPNAATIGGAVTGGAGTALIGKLGQIASESGVVNKVQRAWEDALGATKSGIKAGSKAAVRSGESPAEFLAHSGIAPETEEVNGRQVFTTGADSNVYKTINQRASALTDLRDKLIDSAGSGGSVDVNGGMQLPHKPVGTITDLRSQLENEANTRFFGKERQQVIDHLNSELDAFKQQLGGDNLTLPQENTIKKYFQSNSNYDTTRPSTITEANKMAAALARKSVEDHATASGIPGIDKLNAAIQQHLDFLGPQGILAKLNGQTVKGGRLGTHFKEVIGGGIGGALGGVLGGGPIGEAAGAIGGAAAGNLYSRVLQKLSVGGSFTAARLGRIAQEEPQVVQDLLKVLEQRGGGKPTSAVAPRLVPKSGYKGNRAAQSLLKAGIRTGTQAGDLTGAPQ